MILMQDQKRTPHKFKAPAAADAWGTHFLKCILTSETKLDDLWKFSVTNFLTKVAQI